MWKLHGQCLQRDDQRNRPKLTHKPDEKPLIELLGEPSPEKKLKYKQDIRGNHEKVGFECIESQASQGESQVACFRCLCQIEVLMQCVTDLRE